MAQTHSVLTEMKIEQWLQDGVFTWQWWLLIAMLIGPWIIWCLLVDKRRITPICLIGMFVLATASWMDDLGSDLLLWYYPYKIVPVFPQIVPVNYAVLPVTFMLIYQYFISWRSYIKAMLIMSALYSFVAEPVLNYLGMYIMLRWQYYYSFPLYMLIAISHRWLLEKILAISMKYKKQQKWSD
jgi:hypothetical protein